MTIVVWWRKCVVPRNLLDYPANMGLSVRPKHSWTLLALAVSWWERKCIEWDKTLIRKGGTLIQWLPSFYRRKRQQLAPTSIMVIWHPISLFHQFTWCISSACQASTSLDDNNDSTFRPYPCRNKETLTYNWRHALLTVATKRAATQSGQPMSSIEVRLDLESTCRRASLLVLFSTRRSCALLLQ